MLNDNRRWIFCTCLYKGNMQKNLPCLKSEYQTIISLQNRLLSQTYVSLGNSYISMVEQFHQLDYGRFGVLTVQVTNLSAKVIMICNHIRLIRNRSRIGRWQKVSSAVLPRNCTWHPENLGYRERFHWESALGPPKIVAKKKPGGKPGEFFVCYKRNKFICWAQ